MHPQRKAGQAWNSTPFRESPRDWRGGGLGGLVRSGWSARWLALALVAAPLAAAPFSYQGRLVDNNQPAQGEYELRFRLYDAANAGAVVGTELNFPTVGVTNGLFTLALDFGPGVFTGADRWVELAARPKGSADPYSVFSPRTALTAVPYALFAQGTPGDASALVTGTVPDGRLSLNVARIANVNTSSNFLSDRIYATQADLQAQVNALSEQVAQLTAALPPNSGVVAPTLPSGLVIASPVNADLRYLSQGLVQFARFEAPAWVSGSTLNAPGARHTHGAVWTGSAMLVWGGLNGLNALATGGSYDPATETWTALPTVNAPEARRGAAVAWTGERLLVWGGQGSSSPLRSGGQYSPANRLWTPTSLVGAPSERSGQASAWTGARLFVWGGRNDDGLLASGATYDPLGDLWETLPTTGAPAARRLATATWCGDRVIVWGGEGEAGEADTGAMLPLAGGVTHGNWIALSTVNAPAPRQGHTAVWTGTRLLIWGGKAAGVPRNDGAAFDPLSNSWTPLSPTNAPSARSAHVALWTGREMVVFGGEDATGSLGSGAGYDPVDGLWRPLSPAGSPLARRAHTGVWTGTELLVFGGLGAGTPASAVAAVQRLVPEPTWYLYRKP